MNNLNNLYPERNQQDMVRMNHHANKVYYQINPDDKDEYRTVYMHLNVFNSNLTPRFSNYIKGSVPPNLELTVITSSVIGGVSIMGGTGTVIGSTLATILFAAIGSSLIFTNVSAYWLRAVMGVMILATVLADMVRRRRF